MSGHERRIFLKGGTRAEDFRGRFSYRQLIWVLDSEASLPPSLSLSDEERNEIRAADQRAIQADIWIRVSSTGHRGSNSIILVWSDGSILFSGYRTRPHESVEVVATDVEHLKRQLKELNRKEEETIV